MALKAGYIGVKKSLLGVINSLSSAKFIKSFGDGLSLSDAGKLSLTSATASTIGGIKVGSGVAMSGGKLNLSIASDESLGGVKAGEGVSIDEDGTLNVTASGGVDFSTDEVDTGIKWIDGKTIYRKVLSGNSVPADGTTLISGVDHVVNAYGSQFVSTKNVWYQFPFTLGQNAQIRWELYTTSHDIKLVFAESNITNYSWIFEYTKVSEE